MINIRIKLECPVCLKQTTVEEVFKLAFAELDATLCPIHHCMLIGYITEQMLDWDEKIEGKIDEQNNRQNDYRTERLQDNRRDVL